MSEGSSVIAVTALDELTQTAVRLDDAELRRLRAALKMASEHSRAEHSAGVSGLVDAIAHAIEHGNTLVLGYSEAPGQVDEGDLVARVRALTDQLVPDLDLPSEAAVILARRNAKRRTELLQEFGALSGEQIAEERSRAANRHALAARWRKEGRIFGVPYRGLTLYPAFQFDADGAVRPAVSRVLAALPRARMSEWEVALWWTSANAAVGGARPVDLLDTRPDDLVPAAARLGEPLPV
jgi:hypothetical protein